MSSSSIVTGTGASRVASSGSVLRAGGRLLVERVGAEAVDGEDGAFFAQGVGNLFSSLSGSFSHTERTEVMGRFALLKPARGADFCPFFCSRGKIAVTGGALSVIHGLVALITVGFPSLFARLDGEPSGTYDALLCRRQHLGRMHHIAHSGKESSALTS